MNSYKVKYHKKAKKFIKTHGKDGLRLYKAFAEIAENKENSYKYDIVTYKSKDNNMFRLRIGKYRAIFKVVDDEIIIYVLNIDSRGDIYK